MRLQQAIALLVVAVLVTPAASQEPSSRVRSLAEMRFGTVILQQWDLSCGAAALATLFTYDLGDPVSERAVATAMLHETDPIRVRTRGGFSLLNMQEFAEGRGYAADGYGNLTLNDLPALLPAIVPLVLHGYEHFVVVRTVGGDQIFFADPAYGVRALSRPAFERAWTRKVALTVARK
jgi:predicted double-glycine peptidase